MKSNIFRWWTRIGWWISADSAICYENLLNGSDEPNWILCVYPLKCLKYYLWKKIITLTQAPLGPSFLVSYYYHQWRCPFMPRHLRFNRQMEARRGLTDKAPSSPGPAVDWAARLPWIIHQMAGFPGHILVMPPQGLMEGAAWCQFQVFQQIMHWWG